MIITGKNLKSLIKQFDIINKKSYDQFSLSLSLDKQILRFKENIPYITYGQEILDEYMERISLQDGYILKPGQAILACSSENIKMPKGYMGLLQTKGSLARLFITIHCCDGQIESGYNGKVTFEICNMGTIPVKLNTGQNIAQMFIFKTSCDDEIYEGKYNNADQPTISNKRYNNL